MYLMTQFDPTRAIEEAVRDITVWLFVGFVVVPLLLIWLIVSGAKFGIAINDYILVKNYSMDNDRYELAKGKPFSIEEGYYSEIMYTNGYRNFIIKASGSAETPVYVLYKVKHPDKGIIYNEKYQRDEVITRAAIMLVPAVLLIPCFDGLF